MSRGVTIHRLILADAAAVKEGGAFGNILGRNLNHTLTTQIPAGVGRGLVNFGAQGALGGAVVGAGHGAYQELMRDPSERQGYIASMGMGALKGGVVGGALGAGAGAVAGGVQGAARGVERFSRQMAGSNAAMQSAGNFAKNLAPGVNVPAIPAMRQGFQNVAGHAQTVHNTLNSAMTNPLAGIGTGAVLTGGALAANSMLKPASAYDIAEHLAIPTAGGALIGGAVGAARGVGEELLAHPDDRIGYKNRIAQYALPGAVQGGAIGAGAGALNGMVGSQLAKFAPEAAAPFGHALAGAAGLGATIVGARTRPVNLMLEHPPGGGAGIAPGHGQPLPIAPMPAAEHKVASYVIPVANIGGRYGAIAGGISGGIQEYQSAPEDRRGYANSIGAGAVRGGIRGAGAAAALSLPFPIAGSLASPFVGLAAGIGASRDELRFDNILNDAPPRRHAAPSPADVVPQAAAAGTLARDPIAAKLASILVAGGITDPGIAPSVGPGELDEDAETLAMRRRMEVLSRAAPSRLGSGVVTPAPERASS
jgi:hypothetical protein